ncbi:NACHT and WD40 domain protein [Cadophora sp. MPI-SDFR-AT-0126]|nr:NACHT and WD40 domain protein [Leotiomycetes sp. MPI-SDFR-AT-0126]
MFTLAKAKVNLNDLLGFLPIAKDALFNAYARQDEPACLPNTRVDLLQEIYDWADGKAGHNERCIFWLSGLAGTGKSTISRTVARRCSEQKRLGASFFFSRGGGDVSHAGKFFTSLAVQLADAVPSLQTHIRDAVRERGDIANLSLLDQWRELVLGPLKLVKADKLSSPSSYLLIIDALDECDNEDHIRIILQLLAEARLLTTVRLRVFLTSRPEAPIRHGIRAIPQAEHQDFVLHNIQPMIVNHDISLFLEYHLGIIGQEWTLGPKWPGEEVLRQLVVHASGLFIWAATACRFINEGKEFAEDRLDEILEGTGFDGTPEQHLDQIYITVLQSSIPTTFRPLEKVRLCVRQRRILGSIAILFSPLPAASLANVISISGTQVTQTLERLQAILDVPKDVAGLLRLHHPSFRDFLLNKDRCGEFWVDEKETHQILATSCIQLMSRTLKKDICEMHAPGSQASQVESSRIKECLPSEVQYACLYWVQHLQRSGAHLHDNCQVHQFLQVHLLHWLEALAWIGKTLEGILAILSLETYIPANQSPNLHAFIYDIKRFTLSNRSVIEQAPLQLYCAALLFAPENSIVRRRFGDCIPHWIQLKPRVQAHWNAALQTLEGHLGEVNTVAFSPGGGLVVSGSSSDNTVRLWDAATGALQQTLKGHSSPVAAVAFSPDGRVVVSGSGNTVRLWDAATGALQQTLKGHSSFVTTVAFSPNGRVVVSGSGFFDNTVRFWDVTTGVLQQTLEGHRGSVTAVAFSPDGRIIVSGSNDKTMRLWDAATGALQRTLGGHSNSVTAVAFSPNGRVVVSGSRDKTVRLWDAATRAIPQTLKGHLGSINAVAFSPDGRVVISGSDDNTVRLWDAATRALQQTLEGHSNSVTAVAFSPNGRVVVSGSRDKTVRLWDAATRAIQQTVEGHSDKVNAVAFSPDGQVVVSGSNDNTVRLWDAATGALQQTLKGHSSFVTTIAFSPNGRVIVSGSRFSDNTVRLWDVASGVLQQTLKVYLIRISAVAFSPDGRVVVSGSRLFEDTVRLWDAATGALQQTLEGHSDMVKSIALSNSDFNGVLVSNEWIAEGGMNILWLSPDYRASSTATWNNSIVLGHSSGNVSFLKFTPGPKVV